MRTIPDVCHAVSCRLVKGVALECLSAGGNASWAVVQGAKVLRMYMTAQNLPVLEMADLALHCARDWLLPEWRGVDITDSHAITRKDIAA